MPLLLCFAQPSVWWAVGVDVVQVGAFHETVGFEAVEALHTHRIELFFYSHLLSEFEECFLY